MKEHDDKKIVFTNGIFDLLHPGHIEILKFCKSLGDRLVVGINSDRATKILKGSGRPIHNEYHRKMVLENLSCVDEVIIFDEVRPTNIVRDLMPHIMVKGDERTTAEIRKIDGIPDAVEIVTYPISTDSDGKKLSTTAIIERMRKTIS